MNDKSKVTNYEAHKRPIVLENAGITDSNVIGQGQAIQQLITQDNTVIEVPLKDVQVVPTLTKTLISPVKLTRDTDASLRIHKGIVDFRVYEKKIKTKINNDVIMAETPHENTPIYSARKTSGLTANIPLTREGTKVARIQQQATLHEAMGHPGLAKLKDICKISRMNFTPTAENEQICKVCIEGKMTRRPRRGKSVNTNAQGNGEVDTFSRPGLAMDVASMTPSAMGNKYVVIIVDLRTKYTWLIPIKSKSSEDLATALEQMMRQAISLNKYLEIGPTLLLDNDPAYGDKAAQRPSLSKYDHTEDSLTQHGPFAKLCREYHIQVTFTNKNTSTQNGVCERRIRTYRERLRVAILGSGHRVKHWDLITKYHTWFILNLWPTKDQDKSPWELYYGTPPPNVNRIWPIGAKVYVHDPVNRDKMMSQVTYTGTHLGWDLIRTTEGIAHVREWHLTKEGKIKHSRDTRVDETIKPLLEGPHAGETVTSSRVRELQELNSPSQHNDTDDEDLDIRDNAIPPTSVNESTEVRRSTRTRPTTERFNPTENNDRPQLGKLHVGYTSECKDTRALTYEESLGEAGSVLLSAESEIPADYKDPQSITEAMNCPVFGKYWKEAIKKEIKQLTDTGTLEVIDRTESAQLNAGKPLDLKWVFKLKVLEQPNRFKARLCVRGFLQDKSTIAETFAPTARMATNNIILVYAAFYNLKLSTIDIEGAFLKATLKNPLLTEPPPGIELPPGKLFKIIKSMYGLKEAPHLFGKLLGSALKEFGLKQCIHDECLWHMMDIKNGEKIVMSTHVDDILIAAPKGFVERLAEHLKASKANLIANLSDLKVHLGRQYEKCNLTGTIKVRMYKHIDVLNKMYNPDNKSSKTPTAYTKELVSPSEEDKEKYKFREVVGSLMFISGLRPDIRYAVMRLARFMHSYGKEHYKAALKIVQYLGRTRDSGLDINPLEIVNLDLSAESDSDWAADPNERRSTQGYLILLGGRVIDYRSHLDKAISLSTAEAECRALSACAEQIVIYQKMMKELGVRQNKPTIIHTDSQNVIQSLQGKSGLSKAARHIAVKYFYLRQLIDQEKIKVEYKNTKELRADILTKGLKQEDHFRLCDKFPGLEKVSQVSNDNTQIDNHQLIQPHPLPINQQLVTCV
jgi:hypothetical protein